MYALLASDTTFPAPLPLGSSGDDLWSSTTLPSVLVVDDEAVIADTLAQILNRNGFKAYACYSGLEAVEAARVLRPTTLLSDIAMPLLDGIDAAVAIREFCPATRIVLFSGQYATLEILDRIHSLGHEFELLPKPIHPTELLRRLRTTATGDLL